MTTKNLVFGICLAASVKLAALEVVNPLPRVKVVQGDVASFTAQFGGGSSNSVSFAAKDASGNNLGQVAKDNSSGSLVWNYDTALASPGLQVIELVTLDGGSVSDRKPLILDVVKSTRMQQWRQNYFGSSPATGAALDSADPDGDGLSNLAEFAFGLNPNATDSRDSGTRAEAAEAAGVTEAAGMRAVFRRRKDRQAAGLDYIAEFSSDLKDWTPSSVDPAILADEGELERVGLTFPILPNGRQSTFFRLRLQTQAP